MSVKLSQSISLPPQLQALATTTLVVRTSCPQGREQHERVRYCSQITKTAVADITLTNSRVAESVRESTAQHY
jgi:hypothetical protein